VFDAQALSCSYIDEPMDVLDINSLLYIYFRRNRYSVRRKIIGDLQHSDTNEINLITYLFNTKFDAKSINKENSFPWQVYPRFAISKARRPNPAPGTKICTSDGVLEI